MNVILIIFPIEQRGGAMGIMGLVITFAPAIGPTLFGYLVGHHSWRLLFYIVLPIAILDLLFAVVSVLETFPLPFRTRIDPLRSPMNTSSRSRSTISETRSPL